MEPLGGTCGGTCGGGCTVFAAGGAGVTMALGGFARAAERLVCAVLRFDFPLVTLAAEGATVAAAVATTTAPVVMLLLVVVETPEAALELEGILPSFLETSFSLSLVEGLKKFMIVFGLADSVLVSWDFMETAGVIGFEEMGLEVVPVVTATGGGTKAGGVGGSRAAFA
jgi:hypothetical protein